MYSNGLGMDMVTSTSIYKGDVKMAEQIEIKDPNGNTTYRRNFMTGFTEEMSYLGNTLIAYRNSDGKYIEYDNETGEPIEFTIPITH